MTLDYKLNPLAFILAIGCIVFLCLWLSTCNKAKQNEKDGKNLVNALNDSLRKKNDSTSTISVIQTDKPKDFLELQVKDQQIKDLQEVVKQYEHKKQLKEGSSVTNFKTETTVKNTNKTTVEKVDTVRGKDSLVYLYPTYSDSIKNEWITYKGKMNKDSSSLFLKVHNSYSVVIGVDKKKPFVDIVNHNPYDSTSSVRTYQVKLPAPKQWGIGPSGGVTYYTGKFRPYIGFSINYNIIRF